MFARFHPRFEKQLGRLSPKLQRLVERRLDLFYDEPFHEQLRNHPLKGRFHGHRSIDITGDIRAIYRPDGKDIALFTHVGTHSQLYGR